MMHGLATIVPDATTMPELLGHCNEQMFNTKEEQYDILERILQKPKLATEWGAYNKKRASKYSLDFYCNNLHKIFTEQLNKNNYYETLRPRNRAKLDKYLDKYKKITGNDLKKIRRFINLSNQSVPNHRLSNIMYHAGYEQILENNETVFVDKK